MRNYLGDYDLLAVSANLKETGLNTFQSLDTSLLVDKSTIINLEQRREDNSDELTGKEEPDTVYDRGALANATFPFSKAQAQHFAFLYAYALGNISSSAYGGGFKHILTPTDSIDNPSFTAAMRLGKVIMKRRFASMFVDTVKSTFAKDSWAKLEGGIKGTGRFSDNMEKETVSAPYNSTSLTLAANVVHGSTAQERLDNVHQIRAQNPATGEWVDVECTAVSSAAPAILTIDAPGAVTGIKTAEGAVKSFGQTSKSSIKGSNDLLNQLKSNWLAVSAAVAGAMIAINKAWNLADMASQFDEQKTALGLQGKEQLTALNQYINDVKKSALSAAQTKN